MMRMTFEMIHMTINHLKKLAPDDKLPAPTRVAHIVESRILVANNT